MILFFLINGQVKDTCMSQLIFSCLCSWLDAFYVTFEWGCCVNVAPVFASKTIAQDMGLTEHWIFLEIDMYRDTALLYLLWKLVVNGSTSSVYLKVDLSSCLVVFMLLDYHSENLGRHFLVLF